MKTVEELRAQLVELGVRAGGVLLVHTSFRAVRPVEDGPRGLIAALDAALGSGGTLVMPTMTGGETPFDPHTTPTEGMGIVAETFRREPGVLRSTHPGGSFAARGPLAERICAPQPLEPPHGPDSPPGRVVELEGQVLLLGVTQSESTILHVAESLAGVPYFIAHPCMLPDGRQVTIRETDHCCRGFRRVDEWVTVREGKVGSADAKLTNAREVIDAVVPRLRDDPLLFLCGQGCAECDAARASVDGQRVG
jgi:aminoglycoside 3-N-acetyltransferase